MVLLAIVFFGLIVLVVIAVVMYVISTQRELVKLDEMGNNALSQIGVQLQSRFDAIAALVKMTQQYAQHEYESLTQVIAQRRVSEIRTVDDVNQQTDLLGSVMGRLMAVSESYPDLKASQVYQDTMAGIREYEENVRMSRMIYNDSATKMNRMVRQWPSSFVASMLHFDLRKYLEDVPSKAEYPNMDAPVGSSQNSGRQPVTPQPTPQQPRNPIGFNVPTTE